MFGNNQGNFQLRRFTRRENTAKSFFFFWGGGTFLTHTVEACGVASDKNLTYSVICLQIKSCFINILGIYFDRTLQKPHRAAQSYINF